MRLLICLALSSTMLAACKDEPPDSQSEHWRVQHYQSPCIGEGIRLCYLVDRGNGEFEYFYDEIEGLQYRWGFTHDILVNSIPRHDAMADASAFTYRLDSLLGRERAAPQATFRLAVTLEGASLIADSQGACTLLGAIAIDTREQTCAALRGRETVMFRHHPSESLLIPVSDSP